jgi:hypothetical protein
MIFDYSERIKAALNFGLLVDDLLCDGQVHRVSTQLKSNGYKKTSKTIRNTT